MVSHSCWHRGPLPDIQDFKQAQHTKADSTGKKARRPNLRVIPKGQFEKLSSTGEIVHRLFGIPVRESP